MKQLGIGFVFGVAIAVIVFTVWQFLPKRFRSPRSVAVMELIIITSSVFVIYRWRDTLWLDVSAVAWSQRIFGMVAGLTIRAWVAQVIKDIVGFDSYVVKKSVTDNEIGHNSPSIKPQNEANELSPTTNKSGESLRWWESEPWRALMVISFIGIGALLLPHLGELIDRFKHSRQFKLGNFEVTLGPDARNKAKMNVERTRQKTSIQFLGIFTDRDALFQRIKSDVRYLEGLAIMNRLSSEEVDAKSFVSGNDAFEQLFDVVILPVTLCIDEQIKAGQDIELLRNFTREFAWNYRRLLVQPERNERNNVKGKIRTNPIIELMKGTNFWLDQHAADGCKKSVKRISLSKVNAIRNTAWTYVCLAVFDYINADRLAAIQLLESQKKKFSHNMALHAVLAQLWEQEGHTTEQAIVSYRTLFNLAKEFNYFTDQAKEVRYSAEQKNNAEYDQKRGLKAQFRAESGLAYSQALSNKDEDKNASLSHARSALISSYKSIQKEVTPGGVEKGNTSLENMKPVETINQAISMMKRNPNASVTRELLDQFWAIADTYALAQLLSASEVDDNEKKSDAMMCAKELLLKAKAWQSERIDDLILTCSQGCRSFRSEYASLDDAFQAIAGHLQLAIEEINKLDTNSRCSEERIWEALENKPHS